MNQKLLILSALLSAAATGCMTSHPKAPEAAGNLQEKLDMSSFYLPNATASRIVSVTQGTNGMVAASLLIQTHAVAVKETGPAETVAKFGEVYAFSPGFMAAYQDEPTLMRFWNLQPDDNHDFMLIDPHGQVLLSQLLPPLQEKDYIFTFHEPGLYNMPCAMHQPSMNAQILVLPPRAK